jgi:hypothetical protein
MVIKVLYEFLRDNLGEIDVTSETLKSPQKPSLTMFGAKRRSFQKDFSLLSARF